MSINMKNINLNNIIKIAKKINSPICFFKRTKLMKTNIILLLFFINILYTQTEYTHPETQRSFYQTSVYHTFSINNVLIDGVEAVEAEYNEDVLIDGYPPVQDLDLLCTLHLIVQFAHRQQAATSEYR